MSRPRMCPTHPGQPAGECGYCERAIAEREFSGAGSWPDGFDHPDEAAHEIRVDEIGGSR